MQPLAPDERFRFSCGPDVPCFNACCRDLTQFLTPYDILRLKRHLAMPSDRFLARYTRGHLGPQTGLPVVSLKTDARDGFRCPFVTPTGCGVYPHRPSSCRLYPLARAVVRSPQSGAIRAHYALLREPHCRGFEGRQSWTPRSWTAAQGLDEYLAMNDKLLEIIRLKRQRRPGPLNPRQQRLFRLACYDLDRFRDYVCSERLAAPLPYREGAAAGLDEDTDLLARGLEWIKGVLFGSDAPERP
jgi:Fe-S-cluster containining protein